MKAKLILLAFVLTLGQGMCVVWAYQKGKQDCKKENRMSKNDL